MNKFAVQIIIALSLAIATRFGAAAFYGLLSFYCAVTLLGLRQIGLALLQAATLVVSWWLLHGHLEPARTPALAQHTSTSTWLHYLYLPLITILVGVCALALFAGIFIYRDVLLDKLRRKSR